MSFRIGVVVNGLDSAERMRAFKAGLLERIPKMLADIGETVRSRAVEGYLSGPRPEHLGRVTGNLARLEAVKIGDGSVTVGNNLPYGGIWEYGFSGTQDVREFMRRVNTAKGSILQRVSAHTRRVNIEARPYLAPALEDSMEKIREIAAYWANDSMREAFS